MLPAFGPESGSCSLGRVSDKLHHAEQPAVLWSMDWLKPGTSGVEKWKCSEIRRLPVPVQLYPNKLPTPGNHRCNNLNNGGTNREEISLPVSILLGEHWACIKVDPGAWQHPLAGKNRLERWKKAPKSGIYPKSTFPKGCFEHAAWELLAAAYSWQMWGPL